MLRKQNQLNSGIIRLGVIGLIGYIIATNWSTIASAFATARTATAAASPVIGIVVRVIIGAAVLVGVSYVAWRYRAEIKAGFKYAAEKTVEGAEYTARKIKAGVVYIKDKAKEGAITAVDRLGGSLKEFAHSGEHPMKYQLVQELLQQKGIKEVVNDTIKIAKADNSSVLPAIKSAMKSMIESAIRLGTLGSADKDNLEKQMKIVDRLDKILTNNTLDTEEFNLVTTIFSKILRVKLKVFWMTMIKIRENIQSKQHFFKECLGLYHHSLH
ncbi:MAG: hypothetical protein ACR5KX_01145 [Wolbachia sp.]